VQIANAIAFKNRVMEQSHACVGGSRIGLSFKISYVSRIIFSVLYQVCRLVRGFISKWSTNNITLTTLIRPSYEKLRITCFFVAELLSSFTFLDLNGEARNGTSRSKAITLPYDHIMLLFGMWSAIEYTVTECHERSI
jgi:hypothetical protein